MNLAQLIPILLQISIALIVFAVGLQAKRGDLTYLLRNPSLLLRSVLAMNVIMPLIAAGIAGAFHLKPELETALVLLAVSPVPPVLTGKEAKAGGNVSYGIGLLAVSAALAIVAVPASVTLIARLFGFDVHVPMALIAKVVGVSVLGPLILGVLVQRVAPALAARAAKPLSRVATILLLLAFVPALLASGRTLLARVGDFTVAAILLFVLLGLAVGHLLGGPAPEDRTVLALSTSSRHPAVAIAVAGALVQDKEALSMTVLLAFLVSAIVTAPYAKWRARRTAAAARGGA